MQLTRFSDYGLRLMMMAAAHGDRRITIEETANAYNISRAHLMKVAQLLVREGFLKATRGRSGGLTLAKPAETIMIGDIVRATKTDFAIVECMGRGNQCRITRGCRLRGLLGEALSAFLEVLDRHTLAELALTPEDFGFPQAA